MTPTIKFEDVLSWKHRELLQETPEVHLNVAEPVNWDNLPWTKESLVKALREAQAAAQVRALGQERLGALMWTTGLWTDDDLMALIEHPDVREDPVLVGHWRKTLADRIDDGEDSPGPGRFTSWEVVDRANRALSRLGLSPDRETTLNEHVHALLDDFEQRYAGVLETMASLLPKMGGIAVLEVMRPHVHNLQVAEAFDLALLNAWVRPMPGAVLTESKRQRRWASISA